MGTDKGTTDDRIAKIGADIAEMKDTIKAMYSLIAYQRDELVDEVRVPRFERLPDDTVRLLGDPRAAEQPERG